MSRLKMLEHKNKGLRSRLNDLEPPSTPFPVQFSTRPDDIYFEVAVYMDCLPTLDTMGRSLTEHTGVTSLTLLPAATLNMKWTMEDSRPKGTLEGVVEHPCTIHQLLAAIFLAWEDFLVPEPGFCRFFKCQPQFWAACACQQEGSIRIQTKDQHDNLQPLAFSYGAVQDPICFASEAANEAVDKAMDDLQELSCKYIDNELVAY